MDSEADQLPGDAGQPYSGQQSYIAQQPYSNQQPYSGPQQPSPGQPYTGQPYPGQAYPGQPYPGQQPYGGPAPYGGQMGTRRPKVRPGRVWYLPALAAFLGGAAWIVFGLFSINSQIDSFARVPLPAGVVTLNHSGSYVVYYEAPGAASGPIHPFRVHIFPAAVGSLQPYTSSVTYNFGSHQGRAVLTFQVARPGRFHVETTGAPSVAGGSHLAFGSSIVGSIIGTVLLSVGLIFIGVVGAIILLVIRIVRVRRARAFAM